MTTADGLPVSSVNDVAQTADGWIWVATHDGLLRFDGVAFDRFSTVDWVNRQSSLNDSQAHIDSDGRVRAVISSRDPGVPNWLDKANVPWGVIQMRWNKASDHPDPTTRKVPFAEVRKHLPPDTPVVTPAERKEQLRHRREGAQMRILW